MKTKIKLLSFCLRTALLGALILLSTCLTVLADFKEDIGFNFLQSELGGDMPTGDGILATQVEARTSYDPLDPYMLDTNDPQFLNPDKTIVKKHRTVSSLNPRLTQLR